MLPTCKTLTWKRRSVRSSFSSLWLTTFSFLWFTKTLCRIHSKSLSLGLSRHICPDRIFLCKTLSLYHTKHAHIIAVMFLFYLVHSTSTPLLSLSLSLSLSLFLSLSLSLLLSLSSWLDQSHVWNCCWGMWWKKERK